MFQFLTVRLKEMEAEAGLTVNQVSIPYGAIKSRFGNLKSVGVTGFQFLTVRLKVRVPRVRGRRRSGFNSLRCD